MKKKIFTLGLSAIMVLNTITMSPGAATEPYVVGASTAADRLSGSSDWFYRQLSAQGQKIYNALTEMYNNNVMLDGQGSYDLVANNIIGNEIAKKYINGDRTLFNDFAAAKDAWDLEHPEAWYVDSSYLSLRTTQDSNNNYHVYIGPGRSDNYYVRGVKNSEDVIQKTNELNAIVNEIVSGAVGTDAEKIKYVHKKIINTISYRFENECTKVNAGYVRTTYALATHEGVCEAYSRSMQLILQKLGIDCVLVHGVQTSGEPESHMWNAVKLDGEWYAVDATWDDPIALDKNGNIKTTDIKGVDGGENETYLLVGKDIIGRNWHESGQVSSGSMVFEYPVIADYSYGSGVLEKNGLSVTFDEALMEEVDSTVYKISFNGDGLSRAAEKGYYFLLKMYDINADGSMDCFEDWYYPAHMLHAMGEEGDFTAGDNLIGAGDKFYTDTENYLVMNVSNCEYVEFAVTAKAPPVWNTPDELISKGGYYSGDYTDIIAQTGLIYNERGGYEQPPYVANARPGLNSPITAGRNYHIHVEFTDLLYRPGQDDVDNAMEGKLNDAEKAMNEDVALGYTGTTYSWGMIGRIDHEFANKPDPKNIVLSCDTHGQHNNLNEIDNACRISAVDYDFTSSKMWADDSVAYQFYLNGLVGVKSNKYANNWAYIFENDYPYAQCKVYSGFDWSLWGQPMLLDNPDDLDLEAMTVMGVDGKEQSLADLRNSMNLDDNDMNGRLTLVVENLDNNREKATAMENVLENQGNLPSEAVLSRSLYEIDFARICRCSVVKTGQSVRLCIGFPPGFDSTMAGVTFKAFHFTRDDAGNIISVEEIPCTVTQYGLVVSCSSFSPFEIVALDSDYIDEEDTSKTVIIAPEYGGVITRANGAVASGVNGIITLEEGESVTLNITPNDDMRLVSVNVDGHNVTSDGTITISYSDIKNSTAIISASFISEVVAQSDQDNGQFIIAPQNAPAANAPVGNQGDQNNNGTVDNGENDGPEDKPENNPDIPPVTEPETNPESNPENNQNTSGDNTDDGVADNSEIIGADITGTDNSDILGNADKKPNTGVYSIAVPIMLLGAAAVVATIRKKNS